MAAVPPAPAAPGGCLLAAAVIASQHYKMLRPHPDAGAGQDSPAALKRRRLAAGLGTKGGLGRGDDDGTQQHSATAEAEAVVGLEVCIDCVSSARTAAAAGARSVELCAALVDGGTTPSIGMVRQVVRAVGGLNGVAVQVIIRPRGGDFLYSEDEEAVMLGDIAAAKEAGADGVVIGALTPDGEVDLPLTGRLIAAARPELAVTFHRAIDLTAEPLRALDQLLSLGVERVLSSGGAASAPEVCPRAVFTCPRARVCMCCGSWLSAIGRVTDFLADVSAPRASRRCAGCKRRRTSTAIR